MAKLKQRFKQWYKRVVAVILLSLSLIFVGAIPAQAWYEWRFLGGQNAGKCLINPKCVDYRWRIHGPGYQLEGLFYTPYIPV